MIPRISFSNIAWELSDEEAVADLLGRAGLDAVDIAPGKYFSDLSVASRADAERVRDWWRTRDFEILGMQALLFGTQGLNLFSNETVRAAMLDRLTAVARVAGWMGARRLVFGSPKNRDRSGLTDDQAAEIAIPFFRTLGDRAMEHGVRFCLEPNPPRYACNFMTTTDEGAAFVRTVDHPGVRLHVDAGTLSINHEDANLMISAYRDLVGYIHICEPDLLPIATRNPIHSELAIALSQWLPHMPLSIEMKAIPIAGLSSIVSAVRALYGSGSRTQEGES